MCGLNGVLSFAGGAEPHRAALERMTSLLTHRGPDGDGVTVDGACGLGHNRLAILDLSDAASQPMRSPCGRWTVVYNGEIYNYRELRTELRSRGIEIRSSGDTEVLLQGFIHWGKALLGRLNGIFALAVWDREARTLFLARDQVGIKPLFYAHTGDAFWFASELGALAAAGLPLDWSAAAATEFLSAGYIMAPETIFAGIRKLEPGAWLEVRADGRTQGPTRYWRAEDVYARGYLQGSRNDLLAGFAETFEAACARQLVADVPVGAFLSSGIDSLAVVTAASRQAGQGFHTFTIGDPSPEKDEAKIAAGYARRLGTVHAEQVVTPDDVIALLDSLPSLFGEPFGDVAAISTYLVSRLARRHVTVALSGDGGDELLFGYERYSRGLWHERARHLPRPLLRAMQHGLGPRGERFGRFAEAADDLALYVAGRRSIGSSLARQLFVAPPESLSAGFEHAVQRIPADAPVADKMMLFDQLTYLEANNLTRVDRAAMRNSLEVRVPLLDMAVVEFALRLPPEIKYWRGQRKHPLRWYLARQFEPEFFDHPKRGFSFSIAEMLRGRLRPLLEQRLTPAFCDAAGLRWPAVQELQRQHQDGIVDRAQLLWRLIVLSQWLQANPAAQTSRPTLPRRAAEAAG